jgi:alpha-amylase/alpha-mannosidase (GH57 family)
MWPAEGAVSQFILPLFASEEIRWIATDRGVLARSGRWGYDAEDPDVLCQPYRGEDGDGVVSVFFRDHWLADHIGFTTSTTRTTMRRPENSSSRSRTASRAA